MTREAWIIVGAALAMFALLGAIYGAYHWLAARRSPPCRSASARTMDRQVQQLQAQVPSPDQRPRLRAGQPPGLQSPLPSDTARIRAAAVAAALRDIAHPLRTPNPHRPGSWAASVWDAHYRRVARDHLLARQQAAQSPSNTIANQESSNHGGH